MKKTNLENELNILSSRLNLKDISESLFFPKFFEIETIRACNANCEMCTINQWENKGKKMDDNLFYKISEELKGYSNWIERVCLSRNGEPLLDGKLSEKIRILKNYGIKEISFSTNASLLNEKKSLSLIDSGLDDIRFSIDGFTKETFESIRRGLKYKEVLRNTLRFIELRNENGIKPKIHIRMVIQPKNAHEESYFRDFWDSKTLCTDVVSSKPMHSWGSQLLGYKGDIKKEIEKYSSIPCISPWSTMIIHFDGNVPLCGCDYNNKILLGNLKEKTIKEIWQSEQFNQIRKTHEEGRRNYIPLCVGCNIWDLDIKKIYPQTAGKII